LTVPPQPSALLPQKWLPGQGEPVMQVPWQQILNEPSVGWLQLGNFFEQLQVF
jgi:hypothetical protein